jgi:hypothetical protein
VAHGSGAVSTPHAAALARDRRGVTGLLVLLFAITYLDRVCISVAGPRIQEDLGIDPVGWGWVTGVFTLAYCLFEIPTGTMGDRLGPRRAHTHRDVVVGLHRTHRRDDQLLSAARRAVPVQTGEAGAFPNASIVVRAGSRPRAAPRCRA